MKRYKLCKDCIHHQPPHPHIYPKLYMPPLIEEEPVCNKSLTPTIRNRQEYCPHYETNPSPRKNKKK